jgi:hypothetical protein
VVLYVQHDSRGEWAAALPGGCINIGAPSIPAFVAFGALLAVMTGCSGTALLGRRRVAVPGAVVVWQRQMSRAAGGLTLIPQRRRGALCRRPGKRQDLLIVVATYLPPPS